VQTGSFAPPPRGGFALVEAEVKHECFDSESCLWRETKKAVINAHSRRSAAKVPQRHREVFCGKSFLAMRGIARRGRDL
jgi:hypothetical protein